MTVGIPDGVAILKYTVKFQVGVEIKGQHQSTIHLIGLGSEVVVFAITIEIPYSINILNAEIEVILVIRGIDGIGVNNGILVFATESRGYIAGYTLADEVFFAPVGECIVGDTHAVVIIEFGELGIDGAVGSDLTTGVHLVVLGIESITCLRRGRVALGICKGLRVGASLGSHGIGVDGGGLCQRDGSIVWRG